MDKQLVLYTGPPFKTDQQMQVSTDPVKVEKKEDQKGEAHTGPVKVEKKDGRRVQVSTGPVKVEKKDGRRVQVSTGPVKVEKKEDRRVKVSTGPEKVEKNVDQTVEVYTGPKPGTSTGQQKRTGGSQSNSIVPHPMNFRQVAYVCGQCKATVWLGKRDFVICERCKHQFVYKLRTHKIVWHNGR